MPQPRRNSNATRRKAKGGAPSQSVDSQLIEDVRRTISEALGKGKSPKAALEEACRLIALSDEGIKRLVLEALEGDRDSFWRTHDRGFGRAPQVVEVAGQVDHRIPLEGLSPAVLEVLAAFDALRHGRGTLRDVTPSKEPEPQALPGTSDNKCYVSSDPPEKPRRAPDF